ncbi:amidase [Phenylobacterium hankyongense]|uniref:Amidase n=1 Tax=Phenylobacterium hankyongense TaxID=1813876 RepID=A0A328B053_9CAUL|nr:amidase family protein [Phenylobacterium hankyongense]RAK58408.1 amidase [Phenylobacterium hankyongense]
MSYGPGSFKRALKRSICLAPLCLALSATPAQLAPAHTPGAPSAGTFDVFETSIPDLQAALSSGKVTSRQLVEAYLARIAAYDQAGPRLNAIVTLNPHALAEADALDRERRTKGPRGPLHGVPLLVKDNYDTAEMPTAGGTLALANSQPSDDAFAIQRLRAAGAIILGKTAMHELASGVTTVSSLTGITRNPYDPARSPGGSSGGTAAAVAANFAVAGMGSDTCGSIRIPAAYQNLFGIRETQGLSSRAGMIPLSSSQDIGGPLARSVTDLAVLLDATVGPDPADPSTLGAGAHVPKSYLAALRPQGLKGARIGVLRAMFGAAPEDKEGLQIVDRALDAMRAQGAEVVEVQVPGMDDLLKDSSVINYEFKFELADYLARHPGTPVKSLAAIIAGGLDHDEVDGRLRQRDAVERKESDGYRAALAKRRALHDLMIKVMAEQRLDAVAYPTSLRKPPLIGGDDVGGGASCQLSATTGLPAIAIPAGFTASALPIGLELLGGDFAEPTLLRLAYGWEQTARPRRAPFSTPRLVEGHAPGPLGSTVVATAPDGRGPAAEVRFSYDQTTGVLGFDAKVVRLGADRVTAVTLQRREGEGSGPVIAQLVATGRTATASSLTLRARDRADFLAGRLFVQLYTRAAPLGVGRADLVPGAYRAPSK